MFDLGCVHKHEIGIARELHPDKRYEDYYTNRCSYY